MNHSEFKKSVYSAGRYVGRVCLWLLAAAFVGALCGALGALFHHGIDEVTRIRLDHPWVIWLLPLAGVVTLGLYRLCRVSFDAGTNLIITSVNTNEPVPILLAPLIVVGTVLSHLFGASVGREGAALQLGGSIGHNLGTLVRADEKDTQIAAMCGMAACFSAMFGTPLAAAVFVLEVIRVGIMRYYALLPCITAAYAAHLTALALGAEPMRFSLTGELPALGVSSIARTAALAALCAVVSIALCVALEGGGKLARKYIKSPYVRIAEGGLLMAVLVAVFGLYDYAGAGTQVIVRAVEGQAEPWAFAVKLLLTALCVAAGFRGGEIVPTLFVGATFGCVAAPWLGLEPGFGAAVGMIALFCSVVNCPLASVLLACEMFTTYDLGLFAVAVAVAFVLSGSFGLYSSQVLVFHKVWGNEADAPVEKKPE